MPEAAVEVPVSLKEKELLIMRKWLTMWAGLFLAWFLLTFDGIEGPSEASIVGVAAISVSIAVITHFRPFTWLVKGGLLFLNF